MSSRRGADRAAPRGRLTTGTAARRRAMRSSAAATSAAIRSRWRARGLRVPGPPQAVEAPAQPVLVGEGQGRRAARRRSSCGELTGRSRSSRDVRGTGSLTAPAPQDPTAGAIAPRRRQDHIACSLQLIACIRATACTRASVSVPAPKGRHDRSRRTLAERPAPGDRLGARRSVGAAAPLPAPDARAQDTDVHRVAATAPRIVLLFPLARLGPLRQGALAELRARRPLDGQPARRRSWSSEGLVRRVADESDGRASRLVRHRRRPRRARAAAAGSASAYLARVTADWDRRPTSPPSPACSAASSTTSPPPCRADAGRRHPHLERDPMSQTTAAERGRRRAPARRRGAPTPTASFTHRQIVTILVGLMLGMFLAALDQTVVSTAIRTIADDLQGYDLQAWATTAFLITSTIATPLYGKLSDIYGRRPFYLFAIGVFVVGSVLCGLADSMYQLAAFRAVQGIGAGGLMSLALAIIGDIVPPRERSRYQGYFMAVFGTSSVLGPVIGGFLAGQDSILGITAGAGSSTSTCRWASLAFVVVWRVLHLPHAAPRAPHRLARRAGADHLPGAAADRRRAGPHLGLGLRPGAGLLRHRRRSASSLFILAERAYRDDALLPLRLFRNRTFAVGSVGSIVMGAGMFGGILLLPQYLQIVHGSSPTVAGLQMIPLVARHHDRRDGLRHRDRADRPVQDLPAGRHRVHGRRAGVAVARRRAPTPRCGRWCRSWCCWAWAWASTSSRSSSPCRTPSPRGRSGVATSSVTFFRQMGGTIGTAAFLSSCSPGCPTDIGERRTPAPRTDPRVAAGGAERAAAGRRRPRRTPRSSSSCPTAWPSRSRSGSRTRSTWCSSSRPASWRSASSCFLFLPQLTLSDKSGIQAMQEAATARDARPPTGPTPAQPAQHGRRGRADVHPAAGRPARETPRADWSTDHRQHVPRRCRPPEGPPRDGELMLSGGRDAVRLGDAAAWPARR